MLQSSLEFSSIVSETEVLKYIQFYMLFYMVM